MTPEQQSALEALAARPLTPSEVSMAESRTDNALAASLSEGRTAAGGQSLAVEELFDSFYTTGDYLTLKAAQLSGNPLAVSAFETLRDAKEIGPGRVNLTLPATAGLLDQLQAAGLLSQAGRDALLARSERPDPIDTATVSEILNG